MKHLVYALPAMFAFAATLPAADLYFGGGDVDLPAGTPLPTTTVGLYGTWSADIRNWAVDPAGSAYTGFANDAALHLGYFTDIVNPQSTNFLTGPVSASYIAASFNGIQGSGLYNRYATLYAMPATTLTPSAGGLVVNTVSSDTTRGIVFRSGVRLAGSAPVRKIGSGIFQLEGACADYDGDVYVHQGAFVLNGSLPGVTNFVFEGIPNFATTSGGGNEFSQGTLRYAPAANQQDKFADDALFTFRRGSLDFRFKDTSRESIGAFDIDTLARVGSSMGGGGTLTLTDAVDGLRRGADGLGCLIFELKNGMMSPNLEVLHSTLPKDVLLPWISSEDARFFALDSGSSLITPLPNVAADASLANWSGLYGADDILHAPDGTYSGALTGPLAVKALSFNNANAGTFDLGGNTLTLASGAIAMRPTAYGKHQTLTNGTVAAASGPLYLSIGTSTAAANLNLNTAVAGTGGLVKFGYNPVYLGGGEDNTYAGPTYVVSGVLGLNKKNAVAIPGDLVLLPGSSVSGSNYANEIAPGAHVTLRPRSFLTVYNQTFNNRLEIAGGTFNLLNTTITLDRADEPVLVFNGGVFQHNTSVTGTLNLQSDVRYDATATEQARFQRVYFADPRATFVMNLQGGVRTFDVADSLTLPEGVPEMSLDAVVIKDGSKAGAVLAKDGTGVLRLTSACQHTGGTLVKGGTLHVATISGAAYENLTAAVSTLNRLDFNRPVGGTFIPGQEITGSLFNGTKYVFDGNDDYSVFISGGATRADIATDVRIAALSRSGDLGRAPATVYSGATLRVDPALTLTNDVSVLAGGALDASGATLAAATTFADGARLVFRPANGLLSLAGELDLTALHAEVPDYRPTDEPVAVATVAQGATGSALLADPDTPYRVFARGTTVYVARRSLPTVILLQ